MNCDSILEQVQHSLDREGRVELPPAGARHLEECGRCRQAAHHLQKIHEALAQSAPSSGDQPSPDFHQRFLARLDREPVHVSGTPGQEPAARRMRPAGPGQGKPRWAGAAAVAAATAAVAAAVVLALALRVPAWSGPGAVAGHPTPVPATPGIPAGTGPAEIGEEHLAPVDRSLELVENLELDGIVTTPHRVYASMGAEVSGLTRGFYEATVSLHHTLTSNAAEPQAHP